MLGIREHLSGRNFNATNPSPDIPMNSLVQEIDYASPDD